MQDLAVQDFNKEKKYSSVVHLLVIHSFFSNLKVIIKLMSTYFDSHAAVMLAQAYLHLENTTL